MQQFTYPVALTPDELGGGFVVTCRDVPEVVTQGDTLAEALEAAEGALEAAIEARWKPPLRRASKTAWIFPSPPATRMASTWQACPSAPPWASGLSWEGQQRRGRPGGNENAHVCKQQGEIDRIKQHRAGADRQELKRRHGCCNTRTA
jgi:predicted RNase H-like HicB family nuclease